MERIPSTPEALRSVMEAAGPAPMVVLEATYGWYWAVETLQGLGAEVHLAHPLGVKGFFVSAGQKTTNVTPLIWRSVADGTPSGSEYCRRTGSGIAGAGCGIGRSCRGGAPPRSRRFTRFWLSVVLWCRCRICSAAAGKRVA